MFRISYFIVFLLFLPSLIAKAQYLPTANPGQQWNILDRVTLYDSYTFIYKVQADSVINGISRPVLSQADSSGVPAIPYGYFIEDSTAQTLTIEFFDTAIRKVHYDFSLMPGDTFHYACPFAQDSGYMLLDSIKPFIDSLGTMRRAFHFSNFNAVSQGDQHRWVEGIGSTDNFLLNVVPCVLFTSPFAQTLCITDSSGQVIFDNPNYANCIEQQISKDEMEITDLKLSPVPADNYLAINGEISHLLNQTFGIYTVSGQLVLQDKLRQDIINVSTLPAGIYLLKIEGMPQSLRWVKL